MPPWSARKPSDIAARAQDLLRVADPSVEIVQTLLDEAPHPVVLATICAADGRREAVTARFQTEFSAEKPAFVLVLGWDVP